jgi:hypothetical protein
MPECLIETHAREKAGMPPEWGWYHLERIGPNGVWGTQIDGAIAPPFRSGPRKGEPNWKQRDPATERRVFITKPEHDAWLAAWELRTGKCSRCTGEGRLIQSSHRDGTKTYRPCEKCKGVNAEPEPAGQLEMFGGERQGEGGGVSDEQEGNS